MGAQLSPSLVFTKTCCVPSFCLNMAVVDVSETREYERSGQVQQATSATVSCGVGFCHYFSFLEAKVDLLCAYQFMWPYSYKHRNMQTCWVLVLFFLLDSFRVHDEKTPKNDCWNLQVFVMFTSTPRCSLCLCS